MKIAIVLPRNMNFCPEAATAIDLCVHDFVRFSRYRDTTRVFGCATGAPFSDVNFEKVAPGEGIERFAGPVAAFAPDLVVVHQHRKSAVRLSRATSVPLIYHRHDLERHRSLFGRWRVRRDYRRFATIVAVSATVAQSLRFGLVLKAPPIAVIHNGLDGNAWHPQRSRRQEILFVGRLAPEKGVLEAAQATIAAIVSRPDWTACFILADPDVHPTYAKAVYDTLDVLQDRIVVHRSAPHHVVQAAFESAAIALVPSKYREPFGRTAIEAFAGGSALITSARGGLLEIVGDGSKTALIAPVIKGEDLTQLIQTLINDGELRAAIAANGLARSKTHFSLSDLSARLDQVYDEVVQS